MMPNWNSLLETAERVKNENENKERQKLLDQFACAYIASGDIPPYVVHEHIIEKAYEFAEDMLKIRNERALK